ncbi:MAG: DUF2334 domain-containing protein [Ignavibacteriales bacterium]|nr:DUF2334 domain-containing protein [Ignavibacteriales bacterium]
MRKALLLFFCISLLCTIQKSLAIAGESSSPKKILIIVEGSSSLKNQAMGDGRQLATLLGHFNAVTTLKGVQDYKFGELSYFDYTFYIGFEVRNAVPTKFLLDVYNTDKPVIWINTGMVEFCQRYDMQKKFGFTVTHIDSVLKFDRIFANNATFTKGEPHLGIIRITNPTKVKILGKAYSSTKQKESPYAISIKNFIYFADSPFAYAIPGDHYNYFADYLHDILHEDHESFHRAMIRIEDVTLFENPDNLREIADILSSRGIPFMVGVIPFFVDPGEGTRLSLSDKPDLVDALQYMVHNGGTIVMHGITHQYKGVTAVDYEFWDDNTGGPIKGETEEADARKIESGIQEFMKNDLYPLVWETPHYTASFTLYKTIAKYFSTACEQRLSIEDADFSQFFPYIINKDLFGQTIYPENLGYVPLNPDKAASRASVDELLKNAKAQLYIRDGFATAFFHAFLDLDLLKQLVDGLEGLGYSFFDMREVALWVKTKDRVILSGTQSYSITLKDQYLSEAYFDESGEVRDRSISEKRILGPITKQVSLKPREFYKAEPTEFREREQSFAEKTISQAERLYDNLFAKEDEWNAAHVLILWNHFARGAFFNDQASFASALRSVNIIADTVFLGQPIIPSKYNLLIVPAAIADSLTPEDISTLTNYVTSGGNIILDSKTDLAGEFGIQYASTQIRVRHVRDKLFPEEQIVWRYPELVNKFDVDNLDKIFCIDEATESPMVIGKRFGKGKVLYINSRFDPHSQQGYSNYPYFIEYIRRYFQLRPIVRREKLEVFFEPGSRRLYSVENLVRSWVSNGIRIIHVSGWHEYPKYTWDYARLIRLAHANGILVYAWLEPPQISQFFWDTHPEWREKNIFGEDAKPAWRYPVALTDTLCVQEMTRLYHSFLESFDWDGVDLAELYFESGRGFEEPKLFTPAHPTARLELKRKYGIDLKAAFDSLSSSYWKTNAKVKETIVNYRVEKIKSIYETLLRSFNEIAKTKPGFQIIVTALDNFGSPELREQFGIDMHSILELQKRFGFMLQVEDPESKWSSDPRRYIDMGKQYSKLVDSSKLMFDLNILTFRKKEAIIPFPTLIQTGTESFHLIRSASLGAPRLTIYSEASVNPQDLSFFSNALASDVHYRFTESGIHVETLSSFVLRLPKEVTEITLDGNPMPPFRDNRYVIPAGEHSIILKPQTTSNFSTHELQTRIMSATGELKSVDYGLREVTLEYSSDVRMLLSLSNMPTSVTIDGSPINFTVMKGNDCFSTFLPSGSHRANIVAGDRFAYGINFTSFWSTTAIAVFSALAISLLLLMYVFLKFVRRSSENRKV